jgi:hypothetical protein
MITKIHRLIIQNTNCISIRIAFFLLAILIPPGIVWAEDWPTFKHDNHRSGITGESLSFPLEKAWSKSSAIPPQTAWPGPAKWDSYANLIDLKSMRDFDPVYYTIVAGNRVYWDRRWTIPFVAPGWIRARCNGRIAPTGRFVCLPPGITEKSISVRTMATPIA